MTEKYDGVSSVFALFVHSVCVAIRKMQLQFDRMLVHTDSTISIMLRVSWIICSFLLCVATFLSSAGAIWLQTLWSVIKTSYRGE